MGSMKNIPLNTWVSRAILLMHFVLIIMSILHYAILGKSWYADTVHRAGLDLYIGTGCMFPSGDTLKKKFVYTQHINY